MEELTHISYHDNTCAWCREEEDEPGKMYASTQKDSINRVHHYYGHKYCLMTFMIHNKTNFENGVYDLPRLVRANV